ncbi:hypothetical protein H0H81_001980 [Sphagnurus paluster]|uniref:Mitochondrial ribosomal protein S11 n=1 Tax=Sphagnurus paluster TaxID=117069 RepID=A0A9P7KPH2_9AGAR|nr:hypothetical protein H0H81_001980 [Sphagnurus paluster]
MLAALRAPARTLCLHQRTLHVSRALANIPPPSAGPENALLTMLDNLSSPPTAGPDGYPSPTPRAPNPFAQRDYTAAIPRYSLYCKSTRNNTLTTLMSDTFVPLAAFSGGSCGFKKVNRSSYEAGYQCAVRTFKAVEALAKGRTFQVDLYFSGFGQGRDAMHRALLTSEGDAVRPLVASITDRTPIKIGGTRSKKARRL